MKTNAAPFVFSQAGKDYGRLTANEMVATPLGRGRIVKHVSDLRRFQRESSSFSRFLMPSFMTAGAPLATGAPAATLASEASGKPAGACCVAATEAPTFFLFSKERESTLNYRTPSRLRVAPSQRVELRALCVTTT